MTEVEQFLAAQEKHRCDRMNSNLTKQQCENNKKSGRYFSCEMCKGLEEKKDMATGPKTASTTCTVDGCGKYRVLGDKCTKHGKAAMAAKPITLIIKEAPGKPAAAIPVLESKQAVDLEPNKKAGSPVYSETIQINLLDVLDQAWIEARVKIADNLKTESDLYAKLQMTGAAVGLLRTL